TRKRALAVVTGLALGSASSLASAETCFSVFGGAVQIQFKGNFSKLGYHPATGVTFGALSSCAGLSHWPVVGAAYTEAGSIVLGFRAETVGAWTRGAPDWIVSLDPTTLSGSAQLHNDRTNFSNTTTM